MDTLITVVQVFVYLLIITIVHELGHLAAAFALRFPVIGMTIGDGPELYSIAPRGIRIRFHLLPITGQIKVAFMSKRHWKNIVVAAAGPTVNLVMAVPLLMLTERGTLLHNIGVASLVVGLGNLLPRKGWDGDLIKKEIQLWRQRRQVPRVDKSVEAL